MSKFICTSILSVSRESREIVLFTKNRSVRASILKNARSTIKPEVIHTSCDNPTFVPKDDVHVSQKIFTQNSDFCVYNLHMNITGI